eukprot:2406400-Pleurochrysis_carterae.AAC.1
MSGRKERRERGREGGRKGGWLDGCRRGDVGEGERSRWRRVVAGHAGGVDRGHGKAVNAWRWRLSIGRAPVQARASRTERMRRNARGQAKRGKKGGGMRRSAER